MLTLRGVPKLDLMHCSYYFYNTFFFLTQNKQKHPCKYFSVLQKKMFVQFYCEGKVLLHF